TDDPSTARPDPGELSTRATELARAIRAFAEATAPGAI
ncbi:creatininase family protein, partial [Streptomyces javensis]|nr:creatininase family protein [Streptomyces javensis]